MVNPTLVLHKLLERIPAALVFHQLLACIPAAFVQFLGGIALSRIIMMETFVFFEKDLGWLTIVGRIVVGPFVSATIMDRFGRRASLSLVSLLYAGMWLLLYVSHGNDLHALQLIVLAILSAMAEIVSTVYVSEICAPSFRYLGGRLVFVGLVLGASFEPMVRYFSHTPLVSPSELEVKFIVANLVISIAAMVSTFFSVESIYYLTLQGKNVAAMKSFVWTQPGRHDYDEKMGRIRKYVAVELKKWRSFENNAKAIFTSLGWSILYSVEGHYWHYSRITLSQLVLSDYPSSIGHFILLGVTLLCIVWSCLLPGILRIGRRPFFIGVLSVVSAGNFCIFLSLFSNLSINVTVILRMANTAIHLLILPVAPIASVEILPFSVRAIGGSITFAFHYMVQLCLTTWFFLDERFYEFNSIFTLLSVAAVSYMYVAMPEIKGKAPRRIKKYFTLI